MSGLFRRASFLVVFSPLLLVPIFVAGYFVLTGGDSFDAYRYVSADAGNSALPDARGVYVETPRGFLWLLPFTGPVEEPPADLMPRVEAADARAIVVYRRALDPLERYKMFDLASGREVTVEREQVGKDSALQLRPQGGDWRAGSYGIAVPQEGLASGTDWYYFIVE
jgi:hypothetical protein